jgi:hypothetical protein
MLLPHGIYMDNNWRLDGTVLGIGYGLGWAIWARLWLHLSRLCRLRTVRCIGPWSSHRLSGKARYSLVVGSGSFRTDCQGWKIDGGLSTTLRPALQRWELGVLVWTGTWTYRQNLVDSLRRGMPKVVDCRQTGVQATNEMVM